MKFSSSAVADTINFQPGALSAYECEAFLWAMKRELDCCPLLPTSKRKSLSSHSCMRSPPDTYVAYIKTFQTRPMPRRNSHRRLLQHEQQSSIQSAAFKNVSLTQPSDPISKSHRKNAVFQFETVRRFIEIHPKAKEEKAWMFVTTKFQVELSANLGISVFLFADECLRTKSAVTSLPLMKDFFVCFFWCYFRKQDSSISHRQGEHETTHLMQLVSDSA